jgi:dTDP-4-dehydrorhamnose 3,5-epimerase
MKLDVHRLSIPDVLIIRPERHSDARGFFSETYNRQSFAEAGIHLDFVQDNYSLSVQAGTIRGLHFQAAPFEQAKLVRVVKGRIFDVAVDIRRDSSTFGKYVAADISADDWKQILIPVGFAHGFCTLENNTEVAYKVTNYYSKIHDLGVRWNDAAINVSWPALAADYQLSDKDRQLPLLADVEAF